MTERIIIENFAGIQHLDISLGQINVFIGPQATGKSVCAKVIFYFKSFLAEVFTTALNDGKKANLEASLKRKFREYFPPSTWSQDKFTLRYDVADTFIQIEGNKPNITLTYSDYYSEQLVVWRTKLTNELQQIDVVKITNKLGNDFFSSQSDNLGIVSAFSQFFMPAGRYFFLTLQGSIFSLLSNNMAISDPFLIKFGALYERFKPFDATNIPLSNKNELLKDKIDTLSQLILRGKFIRDRKQEYLLLDDGRQVRLNNLSSGQQELLPLVITLKGVLFLDSDYGYTIYIEEPEAHLFPSAQKKIVELIATVFNMSSKPVQFVITTHSPYLLTTFNNLIHAGNVAAQLDDEGGARLDEVVPVEQRLKTENIKVYSFNHGTCTDIMSSETGLISTNEIDQVSDELAIQFDNLLNVEYSHDEIS